MAKKRRNAAKSDILKTKKKDPKISFKSLLKKKPVVIKRELKYSYGDDTTLTCYDGIWVKREDVESLEKQKAELMKQNLSKKKFGIMMMRIKRKANRAVQVENKTRPLIQKAKAKDKQDTDKDTDIVMAE